MGYHVSHQRLHRQIAKSYEDMLSLDPNKVLHRLNIKPDTKHG